MLPRRHTPLFYIAGPPRLYNLYLLHIANPFVHKKRAIQNGGILAKKGYATNYIISAASILGKILDTCLDAFILAYSQGRLRPCALKVIKRVSTRYKN